MARDYETLYFEQQALHTEETGMLCQERDGWKKKYEEASSALSETVRWASLSEDEYDEVMNGMPGGVRGYLTEWGWLTFAKAIEERLRLKNAPEAPLRPDVGAAITEAKNALHQHACHADALADRLATLLRDFPEAA